MIARTPPADGPVTLRRMLARGHLRLVLLAVFLASVSLMISGVIALRGYAAQNVALSAETLSYTVEPALVFDDREAVGEIVRRLGVSDNLARIVIVDADRCVRSPMAAGQRRRHARHLGGIALVGAGTG